MLYQQYVAKKKLLDSQNPKGTKNERELWHGTAIEAVSSINSLGFNRSYCGINGKSFSCSTMLFKTCILRYSRALYLVVRHNNGEA